MHTVGWVPPAPPHSGDSPELPSPCSLLHGSRCWHCPCSTLCHPPFALTAGSRTYSSLRNPLCMQGRLEAPGSEHLWEPPSTSPSFCAPAWDHSGFPARPSPSCLQQQLAHRCALCWSVLWKVLLLPKTPPFRPQFTSGTNRSFQPLRKPAATKVVGTRCGSRMELNLIWELGSGGHNGSEDIPPFLTHLAIQSVLPGLGGSPNLQGSSDMLSSVGCSVGNDSGY